MILCFCQFVSSLYFLVLGNFRFSTLDYCWLALIYWILSLVWLDISWDKD